jgi:transcriptional regulator with XRE-family HTH domain
VPPAVAEEIEFRRRQLRWSQRELARRCGIGQPQLANVLRGHDRLSAWATRRLRDALRDGLLAEAA